MPLIEAYQMAILGGIGGALPDALRLIEGRHGQLPSYLGNVYFWISLVLLVGLGAAAGHWQAGIFQGAQGDWVRALAVGYTAPSLVSKLMSDSSATTRSLTRRSLRGWWAV